MVNGVVSEHGPQDVDAAAGEGEDGLLVCFTFGAFAVIEGVRLCASAGRDLGGEVHRPQQTSVVSPGTAQIPVDPSGIAGLRCQAGESCELVDAGERGHVAAGGGEEFRGQQWTETGQAHDDVGGAMSAKSFLDRGVEFGDFRVEGDHRLRKSGDHLRGHRFPGQRDALLRGRYRGFLCQCRCAADVLLTQPCFDSGDSGAADRARRLVPGQQHQRPLVGQGQGTFERWTDLEQLCPQAVDLPGAVEDHIEAVTSQDAQVYSDVIARPQQAEVAADPSLVGDDERIAGIFSELKMILQFEGWNLVRRVQ